MDERDKKRIRILLLMTVCFALYFIAHHIYAPAFEKPYWKLGQVMFFVVCFIQVFAFFLGIAYMRRHLFQTVTVKKEPTEPET